MNVRRTLSEMIKVTIVLTLLTPVAMFAVLLYVGLPVPEALITSLRYGIVAAAFVPLFVLIEEGPGLLIECLLALEWKLAPRRR